MAMHLNGQVFIYDLDTSLLNELGHKPNNILNAYDILRSYVTGLDGTNRRRREDDKISPYAAGFIAGEKSGIKQKSTFVYVGDPPLTPDQEQDFINRLYEDLFFIKPVNQKLMFAGVNGLTDYTEHRALTEDDKRRYHTLYEVKNENKSHGHAHHIAHMKSDLTVLLFMTANRHLSEEEVAAVIPCNHTQFEKYKTIAPVLDSFMKKFGREKDGLTKTQRTVIEEMEKNKDVIKAAKSLHVSASSLLSALAMKEDLNTYVKAMRLPDPLRADLDTRDKAAKIYSYYVTHPKEEMAKDKKTDHRGGPGFITTEKIYPVFKKQFDEGYSIKDISTASGIRYEVVRNIINGKGLSPISRNTADDICRKFDISYKGIGAVINSDLLSDARDYRKYHNSDGYTATVCKKCNVSFDTALKTLAEIKKNPEKYKSIVIDARDQQEVKDFKDTVLQKTDEIFDALSSDMDIDEDVDRS